MKIAYLCILIALFLPYVWVVIAKASGQRYDNRDPRGWLSKQTDAKAHRANAAQLNAFEALPGFIAGVLMAQLAQVDVMHITLASVAFIVFRVLHGVFYISNKHQLRSLMWLGGFVCVVFLVVRAITMIM